MVGSGRSTKTDIGDLKIPALRQTPIPCTSLRLGALSTEAIELFRGMAHLLQSLLKGVRLRAVCAEQWIYYPLEKTSPGSIGIDDTD